MSEKNREAALLIRKGRENPISNLRNDSDEVENRSIARQLCKVNLAGIEYSILCRKTSKKIIANVDSREKVDQLASMGIKCHCGNSINNEVIAEILTPSPCYNTCSTKVIG